MGMPRVTRGITHGFPRVFFWIMGGTHGEIRVFFCDSTMGFTPGETRRMRLTLDFTRGCTPGGTNVDSNVVLTPGGIHGKLFTRGIIRLLPGVNGLLICGNGGEIDLAKILRAFGAPDLRSRMVAAAC